MDIKIGFKCDICGDIPYNRECYCKNIEVINKDNVYIVVSDNYDLETYTLYIDNTGRVVKIQKNQLDSLGKDVEYTDIVYNKIVN